MKYIIATILFFSISTPSFANEVRSTEYQEITARANIRGWRFKAIDGNVYQRLYDYSTQKWIGKWTRV